MFLFLFTPLIINISYVDEEKLSCLSTLTHTHFAFPYDIHLHYVTIVYPIKAGKHPYQLHHIQPHLDKIF